MSGAGRGVASSALTRRFARITTSGRVIPEIDGLRFLAISGVILYHGMQQLASRNGVGAYYTAHHGIDRGLIWFLSLGRLGVQFFFVISGLVLGLQYSERHHQHRPPPELGRFYLRRLTRLEPPNMLNLAISYLLVAGLHALGLRAKGAGFRELLPHLGASLAYLHSLVYHDMSTVNGVTWSLEVEAQFYLLMPLFGMLIYLVRGNGARTALLLAAIVVHGLLVGGPAEAPWYLQFSLAGFLGYFLTGILLADLSSSRPLRGAAGDLRWDGAGLAAAAAVPASEYFLHTQGHYPLLFGVICLAALRGRVLKRILSLAPLWIVGGMCYSIYLYHLWILGIGAQALRFAYRPGLPFWENFCVLFPVLAAAVLLVSAGFYLAIERPCMERDWPRRLWRRIAG